MARGCPPRVQVRARTAHAVHGCGAGDGGCDDGALGSVGRDWDVGRDGVDDVEEDGSE